MDADYIARELETATRNRDAARAAMSAAREGSKKWREAEEDLNFWMGKVANMEAARVMFPRPRYLVVRDDYHRDEAGNVVWLHDATADAPLADWRADNAEDEETLEALELLEAGADHVVLGGGAAPMVRLRREELVALTDARGTRMVPRSELLIGTGGLL